MQDPLDGLLERLRLLGASPDEVTAFKEAWYDADADPAERLRLQAMPDSGLRAEIVAVRKEFTFHTRTPEEQAVADADAKHADALAALYEEAYGVVHNPVDQVMVWVNGEPDRAQAVLAWERGNANRKGVIGPCVALVGSDA